MYYTDSRVSALEESGSGDITISFVEVDNGLITRYKEDSTNIGALTIAHDGNTLMLIGNPTSGEQASVDVPIIKDVTPQIINGNTLRVEVNGVSGQVALPTGGKQLVTSGDITQFVSVSGNKLIINKEFDIEYIFAGSPNFYIIRTTISKGEYNFNTDIIQLGLIDYNGSYYYVSGAKNGTISVSVGSSIINTNDIIYTENIESVVVRKYRLYA